MYPQLSTMWGRSNITEVREKHVVTFSTYMLKRQSVHLLSFFLHTMVLRCRSLCLLSECFSCLVLSFSCLSLFEMRAVESSRPVLTRKVIMTMMFEAWGCFVCLSFVSLSATNLNGAVLKGVRMLKKERQEGKLPERSSDMIVLLTDGMPNHGEPLHQTGLSCFHLKQVWHL